MAKLLLIAVLACFLTLIPLGVEAGTSDSVGVTAHGSEATTIPTVSTQDATGVSGVTATLNGTVENAQGGIIEERGFEWGIQSGNYTYSWTEEGYWTVGSFSTTRSDFPPDSTVYYRAMARNSEGWGYGSEVTFVVTIDIPGPPTNLVAVAVGLYQVDLSWTNDIFASSVLVVRKVGSEPVSITDGEQVYFGAGDTYTDYINLTTLDEKVYYSVWSWNYLGYSLTYASTYIGGAMTNSFLFLGMIVLAGILTGVAVPVNLILFRVGAALAWLTLGVLTWTNALGFDISSTWTTILGFVFAVMFIGCITLQMVTEVKRESKGQFWKEFRRGPVEPKVDRRKQAQSEYKAQLRSKWRR